MGMIILSSSVMMRLCTCEAERISFMLWTLMHSGMKPVGGFLRENRLQSAAGQRKNCISGILITGRITGRKELAVIIKMGKHRSLKMSGAFFVLKRRWRDVSSVGCFSEGSQE